MPNHHDIAKLVHVAADRGQFIVDHTIIFTLTEHAGFTFHIKYFL